MLINLISGDRPRSRILTIVLLAIFFGLLFAPFLFPGVRSLETAARISVFILLAASYDLLLGYTGVVSFAHTMFFGMGAYGVGLDQAQWMSIGFLATMSATMLLSSWVIEVFGQRVAYIATLIAFGAGAIMSATAVNMDTMIVGRVVQGAATVADRGGCCSEKAAAAAAGGCGTTATAVALFGRGAR